MFFSLVFSVALITFIYLVALNNFSENRLNVFFFLNVFFYRPPSLDFGFFLI